MCVEGCEDWDASHSTNQTVDWVLHRRSRRQDGPKLDQKTTAYSEQTSPSTCAGQGEYKDHTRNESARCSSTLFEY